MLAEPGGDLVFVGKLVDRIETRRSDRKDGLLIGGGHFSDVELISGLVRDGIHPADARTSIERQWQITKYVGKHKKDLTVERIKKMLQAHGGNDIVTFCHNGLQGATVSVPKRGEFWVAGYRPCQTGFTCYKFGK